MRSVAASVVVALAVAVLALCGTGRALAATAGGSVSAMDVCGNDTGASNVGIASCDAGGGGTGGSNMPGWQPNCQCNSTPSPSATLTATPTCHCQRTPSPTPTCTCTSMVPPTPDSKPAGDTPPKDSKAKGDTPPKPDTPADFVPADSKDTPTLPTTGADMEPLAATASICLIVGTGALAAGRAGRVTRAPGKRRRPRGSRRAAR